jgi:hypothetical protein
MTKRSFSKIELQRKERKCSVCKRWLCNNHCEHLKIQFDCGGNFLDKRILIKITREEKNLAFHIAANKLKP